MSFRVIDPDFTDVMSIYSQKLKYYPGRLCSCVGENNGVPKPDCGCNLGYWYGMPEDIIGIRQSVSYRYLNTPQGRIFDGGAQFTIPRNGNGTNQKAYITLAHGDIISVEGKYRRDTDILRKGIRDKLNAFDIIEVVSIAQKGTVYIAGQDFELNGTEIIWEQTGNKPAEGSYYTVEFTCNQQYKVWEVGAKDRGTTEDQLPRLIICVLRRFANQESNPIDSFEVTKDIFTGN